LNLNLDFVFVITSHRTLPYAKRCIESIQAQLGSFPLSAFYVDDTSSYTDVEIRELKRLLEPIRGELILLQSRHYQIDLFQKPFLESSLLTVLSV
jgi:hypothetical protein